MEGLDSEELRALRLLHRTHDSRSDRVYFAHLGLSARAAGRASGLARPVKIADLKDRCVHRASAPTAGRPLTRGAWACSAIDRILGAVWAGPLPCRQPERALHAAEATFSS